MKDRSCTHQPYAGISRVRKIEDLIFEPVALARLQSIKDKNTCKERLLEAQILDASSEETVTIEARRYLKFA